jgi:hypothetical protein
MRDVLASLRTNPVLASVSEEAMGKIAELVVQETRAQTAAAIRRVALFEGLLEGDYEQLQAISEPVVLEAGDPVFTAGDPADRFFVVVRGGVELTEAGGKGPGTSLGAGRSFGETALFDDAARAATATASEPTYLVAIAREAFQEMLGPGSLPSRILRNVGRKCYGRSDERDQTEEGPGTPREALGEYNRMVRGRSLPRGVPSVPGFDLAGTTVAHARGAGAAGWDWFFLADGRLALALLKADQSSLSSAHRLLAARGLLRDFARDPLPDLGALLTRVNRGLRAGWVEGISGSVSCGVVALSEDGAEWATAGSVGGTVLRADRSHEDLVPDAPALGSDDGLEYRSQRLRLGVGDRLLAFSDGPSDSVIVGRKFLTTAGTYPSEKARLEALVARVGEGSAALDWIFDVTAVLVARTGSAEDAPSGSDAIARAAAAFDREEEERA